MREPRERIGAGFYVWFGGVEGGAFLKYLLGRQSHEYSRAYPDPVLYPEKVRAHLTEGKLIYYTGFGDILRKGTELGLMQPIEELLTSIDAKCPTRIGVKYVGHERWASSLGLGALNLLDAWEVTKYEIVRIKLTNQMLPLMRMIPGWENCYITRTNLYIGSRESRYLRAVTMLTEKDILSARSESDATPLDTVGRSGAHDPGKNRLRVAYPIPYGALVPKELDGVLCCTRAVGAEPRTALNAHRGIVPTIVVGQAAGTAAALAAKSGVEPRQADLAKLQDALRADGAVLDAETTEFDFAVPEAGPKPSGV
jgi:hypothetical protein